ncbi:MAG: hypothetical protein DYG95_26755 [Chlorobi bacterium CHB1]|nr:hypothetical protein [Chlorobi bacterium CHB1]
MPGNLRGFGVKAIKLARRGTLDTSNDPELTVDIFIDARYSIIVAETMRIIGIVLIARKC